MGAEPGEPRTANMRSVFVTLDVSQLISGWLKAVARCQGSQAGHAVCGGAGRAVCGPGGVAGGKRLCGVHPHSVHGGQSATLQMGGTQRVCGDGRA